MKIFDTHAHYDDEKFNEDRDELLKTIHADGVEYIVNCGSSLNGMRMSHALSEKYDFIYSAAGIHPSDGREWSDETEKELRQILKSEKNVAIGEIGLDYYWEDLNPSHEHQMMILERQYEIARETGKPVILHIRDAYGDMVDFLRKNRDVPAVLHSFSGSPEIAREMTGYGMMLGIGGVVTFKNARKLLDVARETPIEFLMTETDAPYLSPEPLRGTRNRSDNIVNVVKKIAELKGMDIDEAEDILFKNALRFFNIKKL